MLCSPTHHRIGHEDDLLFHTSFLEEIGVIRHHAPMIGIHSSLSAHHNGFHGITQANIVNLTAFARVDVSNV